MESADKLNVKLSALEDECAVLKKKITELLEDVCMPMLFKHHEATVGCSIGISHFPKHSERIEDLVRKADTAMMANSAG